MKQASGFNRRRAMRALAGFAAGSPLLRAQVAPTIEDMVNVFDFEPIARGRMTKESFDYLQTGVEDEWTLRRNREGFERYLLRPRMLADASSLDLSCELFGEKLAMPILVAPTGAHQLIHPEGEIATMKASCAVKSLMAISTVSSYPFEKIAEAATGPFWFQLYPGPDREGTDERVARVVAGGAKAIVVTADLPYISHRERLMRNRISGPAPQGLNVPLRRNRIAVESNQPHKYRLQPTYVAQVTWPYISELKSQVKVPVLIKGLMTAEDAELALKHGADGIIVSNHGGRALETAPSTIEVLPEIVAAVKGRVPVLVDGGIRRGTDILKALALGAKAVLVGRAPLWGLGAFGQQGVERVMQILERELALAMGLAGVTSLSRIQSSMVMRSR